MSDWTCPNCGGSDRVVVTDGGTGLKTNRCLTPACGYVEPHVEPHEEPAPDVEPDA